MAIEYFVELLTPNQQQSKDIESNIEKFTTRYNQILHAGYSLSIPDNPIGHLIP